MAKRTWTLTKQFSFEASHVLPHHDGLCHNLHGHTWVVRVEVRGERLHNDGPQQGMVMDFGNIKKAIAPVLVEYLDHHHLNDTIPLLGVDMSTGDDASNPTSEALAAWLFYRLKPEIPLLSAIEIDETPTSRCRYQEEP